jgi:pantothenate kinase, type III
MLRVLIDIGNTASKLAFARGKEIVTVVRGWQQAPLDFLRETMQDPVYELIVLSSVRHKDAEMEAFLREKGPLVVVTGDTKSALKINYATPDRLGSDRLAADLGALTLFKGEDLLVIGFGTAITYDFISKEGYCLGGNISPGLQMRFKALAHYTDGLPLIEMDPDEDIPDCGIDTRGALLAGVVQGITDEISAYILRNGDKKVIFTGGDANFFAKKLKTPIFVDCNLVFIGLAELSKDYA